MEGGRRIRVLIGKVGLDGHDRGAKVIVRALRDAGMEVVYTGIRQTPEMIVEAAIQEDVDVIGLSSLSGGHMSFFPRVLRLVRERGASDILVIGGGIIPEDERERLRKEGAAEIFGPGTSLKTIVDYIRENVAR
ncbi:methylmalonyl-CoA mutase [miscellaneous Crenarchaeota group-15 archaeon DG-45]|uniref:Methylmalonyl-CoA mutase n=1 Tax=miscellaneous Crenarchaeota group-15 archaeon DG-45 TaxID=1685127 RepID=A0A0M0BMS9_9ARCH|nr:MAG: methylmalonyl-CoA mutase [miscellaneous Crenarchaeota group-15 archaeon DG-45]